MYKDAILSNYSHEQLTPLNSILNNAMLLIDYLSKIKNNLNELSHNFKKPDQSLMP
jgi:hypothetical protein